MFPSSLSEYSGHENLEVLSENQRFNDWIFEKVCIGLKGNILEIGSGIGTFSEKIVRNSPANSHITLTDVSSSYVKKLEDRFLRMAPDNKNIHVFKLDLESKKDYQLIGYDKYDSIIAINVLEHIKDDEFALNNLYYMLRNGGRLSLLVPCHKSLYNVIDQKIGHFRRYNKHELLFKISKTKFFVERISYFNMLGIVGWYINGSVLRRSKIGVTSSQLFDKLVPLFKLAENAIGEKIGLSIVCSLLKT